ncbi:hypothetical protein [Streptomyces sp. NPDC006134]|uniref:hypothetical protein n=1 Tax=Streptomyces sp. NPDC006134 TaxID=3154467 RepID=UPI0033DD10F2
MTATLKGVVTHNGQDDGVPVGICYRHPGWEDAWDLGRPPLRFLFSSGAERLVFTDHDGRALMVGWFRPGWRNFR